MAELMTFLFAEQNVTTIQECNITGHCITESYIIQCK